MSRKSSSENQNSESKKKESKSKSKRFPMEISNLPIDILFDILSRLPVKPLIRFSVSSKQFLSLVKHPRFISLHFTRSITDPSSTDGDFSLLYYESSDYTKQYYSLCSRSLIEHKKVEFPFKSSNGYVRIVGSSYGLVCLFDTSYFLCYGGLYLWNTIVGKSVRLPNSLLTHRVCNSFSHMVVGFGFVLEKNDFKVVQILYSFPIEAIPDVLVYSMEANSWRKVDAIPPCYMANSWSNNVYVNGAVHWISDLRASIMSFDMNHEVFREMALPNNRNAGYDEVNLSVSPSGESLSMFLHFSDRWEVWLMKNYGEVESWTKQFSIAEAEIYLPLNFMDNGDVLLVMKSGNLVSCDADNQQMKDLGIHGLPSSFHIVSYNSSLVLLDRGHKVLRPRSSV